MKFEDDTTILTKTQEALQEMVNRLIDTGKKYDMEINIDKWQLIRVVRINGSLQVELDNRELK